MSTPRRALASFRVCLKIVGTLCPRSRGARSGDPVARSHERAMGPNDDRTDDQPIADMLRTIEPARREVGDGGAAADGAARLHPAPLGAATPPVFKGKKRKVGASGYRGVAFHQVSGKYRARITSSTGDGRQRALGYFHTKEEAARAWDDAARGLGWAEDCMNFPNPGSSFPGAGDAGGPSAPPASPVVAPNESDRRATGAPPGDGFAPGAVGFGDSSAAASGARRFDGAFPTLSVAGSSVPETGGDLAETASQMPGALPTGRRRRPGNDTGCKGVRCKGHGLYEARIKLRDKPSRTSLGLFKTALEAMRAYDDSARRAGYCVNECGAVGDLLDSDTYAQIGVATPTIAKGVKTVSKTAAIEMTSRETATATCASTPAVAPNGTAAAAAEPSAARENGGGDGTSPAVPAPLTAAEIAAMAETEPLYAGFILDKPGIHRFLGVFADPKAAHATVKATVPEWKRKNELKQKQHARGGRARADTAAGADGGGGVAAGVRADASPGDRGQTLGGGGGGADAALEAALADDVANA